MLCKKCGANIADTSKFCGYCGEPTNNLNNISQPSTEINNELDLGNTIRIEPVNTEIPSINNKSVIEPVTEQKLENLDGNLVTDVNQQVDNQAITIEQKQIQVDDQVNLNEQIPIESSLPSMPKIETTNTPRVEKNKKKTNKVIWIFLAISLSIIAIVLVALSVTKTSNNTIEILEKSLANLIEKGKNSVTADAKLSMNTSTGESFVFSATVKGEKKNTDLMNMQITVNKSMMFDEMNVYAEISKEKVTLYAMSSLIDMLGMTSSLTPTWVYYTLTLNEVIGDQTPITTIPNIELKDIIDEKHFVYVDKVNELSHYQLIIDQELIDNIKTKLNESLDEETKETINSIETLEDVIKVDFYLNNSSELVKIELDMSDYLTEEDGISSFVMSMEFSNLGSTYVEIPSDAKNSVTDLETYMANNVVDFGMTEGMNDSMIEVDAIY